MTRSEAGARPSDGRFLAILGGILLVGLLLRIAYLLAQPAADLYFARPAFDGAYYLDWARAIAHGARGPAGAFYLAPLYPHLLALLIKLFGGSFMLLYLLQHLLSLLTAAIIAILGRNLIGRYAALAAAALFLLYHPILFFASRPLAETLSIFLMFTALLAGAKSSKRSAAASGFVAGLAALCRPNLLLLPLLWVVGECRSRRFGRAALIVGCALLAILPVTIRNFVHSGHAVLVSSNSGITAYHGNGPNARGLYAMPAGFSGQVASQRKEATAIARSQSGLQLDDVEADNWWGRRALETRLQDPVGSVVLVARRALLTVDNHEHGLDYAPALDSNPWRWVCIVPLALLLGLTAAGVVLKGFRRTGGWWTWSAILACAMAPLLFYVSSRYRLPATALLVLPAGCGLASLFEKGLARKLPALIVGAAVCIVSLAVPFGEMKAIAKGEALAVRAYDHLKAGNLETAMRAARSAFDLAPRSAVVNLNLGIVEEAAGRNDLAEKSFRTALGIDPVLAEAAGNFTKFLILRGEFAQAVPILERALQARPTYEPCWHHLVLAHVGSGAMGEAKETVQRARANGVVLDPAMLQALDVE
jgi:tetratricopeptide (TPR) repeat protein